MTKLTAWSYSRWSAWVRCPMRFKAEFLDRTIPFVKSPQMERGDRIHKSLAAHIGGDEQGAYPPAPEEATRFEKLLSDVAGLRDQAAIQTEQQWGFTDSWKPTGWFDKNTWLRSVLDVCVVYPDDTGDVIDYKTGKKYDDNRDQMELFGLSVLCRYPAVSSVNTRLWYLDIGEEVIDQFCRADVEPLKAKWNARAAQMFADTEFLAKPNDKCRWCPLRKSNGGMCRYG